MKSKLILVGLFGACLFQGSAFAQQHWNWENRVLMDLSDNRTESGTKTMQFFSNTYRAVYLATSTIMIAEGLIAHDKRPVKKSLYILESIGVSFLLAEFGKYTIDRKRPFDANPNIEKAGKGGGPSMPSGTTTESFAFATSLSIAYPKWYVVIPAYGWASTVAYSRLYLGVHYPSDVLVGALLGTGTAFLCYKINKWMRNERNNRKNK